MTGVVPIIPRFKFTDSTGTPIAGGSVTVYLAGTTTLANTYQDQGLTTPNTNPVALDSKGECLFWVDSVSTYKLLLKDANGVTVPGWPVDNVPGGADIGAASNAAQEWATKTSGTVDGAEFSAKEYAHGAQASTGGSAKNWAQQTGADVTGAALNSRSSKSWAQDNLTGATLGGSAKDWAQSASLPDGVNKSSRAYATEAQSSATTAQSAATTAQAVYASVRFATKALMDADLAHAAGEFAVVYADTAASNNGQYYKVGASGSGSWQAYQGDRMARVVVDTTATRETFAWEDVNGYLAGRVDAFDGGLYMGADTDSLQKQIAQRKRDAYEAAVLPLSLPLTTAAGTMLRGDLYAKSKHADSTLGADGFLLYQPLLVEDHVAGAGYRIATLVKTAANRITMICQDTLIPNINTDVQNSRLVALDLAWEPVARTLTTSNLRTLISYRSITTGGSPGVTAFASNPVALKVQYGTNAGRIYLFFTTNKDNANVDNIQPTTAMEMHSDDGGTTWSTPAQIVAFDNAGNGVGEDWSYASGPSAIQLRYGQYAGRLVVPGYIFTAGGYNQFLCGYSDDGGATWQVGSRCGVSSNETAIAEDVDGTIYATARKESARFRDLLKSTDGGLTWSLVTSNYVGSALTEGSMIQAAATAPAGPKFLTAHCQHATIRGDLRVRLSYGRPDTFDKSLQIDSTQSGYSALEMFNEQDVLLVYENDVNYVDTAGVFTNSGGVLHSISSVVFNVNAMS